MSPPQARIEPIERFRLDNGLRVVLHADRSLPLVAVNLWYDVGSRNERPGKTGLAHLFEHMLFQGSAHVGTNDHFRYVQQVGGVANGSTWFDRTNYYETLPSHYLDLGLWLESDRMGFFLPALTEEKLATQRDVVLNERRQRVDNQPYGRAFERLHELLYPEGHPYRWPVIGYEEDIAGASMEDVAAFFGAYYVPNNAVLTLAGDFDPEQARDRVAVYFADIPAGPPVEQPLPLPPEIPSETRETLIDAVELPRIYMGYPGPGYGEPEWYAGDLLSIALADGKSSPMYEDLVYRRQLAKNVGVQTLPTSLAATFLVVATANDGVEPGELEEAVGEHLTAAAEGLDEALVSRAKERLRTEWWEELQSLDQRADLLSSFTIRFDDPERLNREARTYLDLTSEQLSGFARRVLRDERRAVLTVVPE